MEEGNRRSWVCPLFTGRALSATTAADADAAAFGHTCLPVAMADVSAGVALPNVFKEQLSQAGCKERGTACVFTYYNC